MTLLPLVGRRCSRLQLLTPPELLQFAVFATLRDDRMIVLDIQQRHLIVVRLDARLAAQHCELGAPPVDDVLAADVPIEDVLLVAQLMGAVFALDEGWLFGRAVAVGGCFCCSGRERERGAEKCKELLEYGIEYSKIGRNHTKTESKIN